MVSTQLLGVEWFPCNDADWVSRLGKKLDLAEGASNYLSSLRLLQEEKPVSPKALIGVESQKRWSCSTRKALRTSLGSREKLI